MFFFYSWKKKKRKEKKEIEAESGVSGGDDEPKGRKKMKTEGIRHDEIIILILIANMHLIFPFHVCTLCMCINLPKNVETESEKVKIIGRR